MTAAAKLQLILQGRVLVATGPHQDATHLLDPIRCEERVLSKAFFEYADFRGLVCMFAPRLWRSTAVCRVSPKIPTAGKGA